MNSPPIVSTNHQNHYKAVPMNSNHMNHQPIHYFDSHHSLQRPTNKKKHLIYQKLKDNFKQKPLPANKLINQSFAHHCLDTKVNRHQ